MQNSSQQQLVPVIPVLTQDPVLQTMIINWHSRLQGMPVTSTGTGTLAQHPDAVVSAGEYNEEAFKGLDKIIDDASLASSWH